MARELIGVWEPVFNGKHVKDMTDSELDDYADMLFEATVTALEHEQFGG